MEETFTYDDMNRLTGITLKKASGQDLHCAVTYDALGRMTSRQAVTAVNGVPQVTTVFSQPVFHSTKVHALSTTQTQGNLFPTSSQSIAYTGFDKVSKIKQSNDSLCYTYGYDRQRIRMEEYKGNTVHAKDYIGMCEYVTETDLGGTVSKSRTYLTGPYGVFAVVEKRNGEETLHYILKDNLGSWTTITNSVGTVEQQLSYDAWGSRRNPDTWANYTSDDTYAQTMFDRGYTGHEHLSSFGLINMNGRMYDPVVSSFLSADRYVQNPMSAQGFNRYAYCMYNPLRFVDPTGWLSGGGGGYNSNGSLPQVMINGQAVFVLPEITIKPHEFNHEFVFDPYPFADGGGDLQWNNANNEQTIGSAIRGCGGGGINSGKSSIRYMLLDYHQKYHHYSQTDLRGCKIAAARSYYQYFSGNDKGEAYFSTMVNGMITVNSDTYLKEYFEACNLNVQDGMNVDIIYIGQQLEEGHPYSIILKGEHVSGMTDIDHVVTMIGINKNGDAPLQVFIKDPMQKDGQFYDWVNFRNDIKDAYFIIGLRSHKL